MCVSDLVMLYGRYLSELCAHLGFATYRCMQVRYADILYFRRNLRTVWCRQTTLLRDPTPSPYHCYLFAVGGNVSGR